MTYLQFHLLFTLPWLSAFTLFSVNARRRGVPLAGDNRISDRFALLALLVHLAIAMVYTSPWDNYLVFREVWGYPPGRVLATILYVPVEEYAFFVIQTAATGLLLLLLLRARNWRRFAGRLPGRMVRWLGAALLLLGTALGAVAASTPSGTYLGLIFVWALPVIALQWGFGGDLLIRRWRLVATCILLPSAWLWLADGIAISQGIWWISEAATTGIAAFGLPLEEALFFLLTNVLVVFGMTMALDEEATSRALELWRARRKAWKVLLLAWGIAMVPVPLSPDAFAWVAYLSTGLLALGVLGYALEVHGPRALLAFLVAIAFGVVVEAIGSRTGVPFGPYRYTAPGPTILGVPLLVPLGWWAFTLVALAAAPQRGRTFLAPLALVTWDLGLDPLMVEMGFWRFERSDWFGVPLSNFVGWYLSGLALVVALQALLPSLRHDESVPLRMVFAAQAFLIGVGLTLFGMPLAGTVAAVAMVTFAVFAWRGGRNGLAVGR